MLLHEKKKACDPYIKMTFLYNIFMSESNYKLPATIMIQSFWTNRVDPDQTEGG